MIMCHVSVYNVAQLGMKFMKRGGDTKNVFLLKCTINIQAGFIFMFTPSPSFRMSISTLYS